MRSRRDQGGAPVTPWPQRSLYHERPRGWSVGGRAPAGGGPGRGVGGPGTTDRAVSPLPDGRGGPAPRRPAAQRLFERGAGGRRGGGPGGRRGLRPGGGRIPGGGGGGPGE